MRRWHWTSIPLSSLWPPSPSALPGRADGEREHTPDHSARLLDGTGVVVDVRPGNLVDEATAEVFAFTSRVCEEVGWQFRHVSDLHQPYGANLRWLARYRHRRCHRAPVGDQLMEIFVDPLPLLVGAEQVGDRLAVLPVLYHLLWRHELTADLVTAPLGTGHPGAPDVPGPTVNSARPGRLRLGDRVRFQKHTYTVVGLTGMRVRLADTHGVGMLVDQVHLQSAEDFAVLGASDRAALGSAALLDRLPEPVAERALWWQRHLVELLTGPPPDAPAGARVKSEYDPACRSLAERERAKAAELTALGEEVTARTVKRKRQQYEAGGIAAVVDHRLAPHASLLGWADPQVVAAIRQAIGESVPASTRTIEYARWRTERILEAEHGLGAVTMPSRATFYRLFDKLSHGVHVTGSARTRRFTSWGCCAGQWKVTTPATSARCWRSADMQTCCFGTA
ncbi:TnsA-like heteromeric transposase endonuclease subunit [Streptomyces coelicoflavus]|uniref:TnsA-like heteromeric transposase endonuclease subunit n=1 Tax=Streptomyces coelicoflavus TaxID=285562 RepID=UPI003254AED3